MGRSKKKYALYSSKKQPVIIWLAVIIMALGTLDAGICVCCRHGTCAPATDLHYRSAEAECSSCCHAPEKDDSHCGPVKHDGHSADKNHRHDVSCGNTGCLGKRAPEKVAVIRPTRTGYFLLPAALDQLFWAAVPEPHYKSELPGIPQNREQKQVMRC